MTFRADVAGAGRALRPGEAKNVHGLVSKLVEIVPEYWPSPEIISLSALDRHDQALNYRLARASLASQGSAESAA